MKMTKNISVMLIMLLCSLSLFAMGAREQSADETLVKVLSVTGDGDHYDISGINEYDQEVIYHTTSDTSSRFTPDSFVEGDYILVKDTGMMTMSIPAQLTATEIRRVTLAVNAGVLGKSISIENRAPQPAVSSNILLGAFNADDMLDRFNYSYGYLSMKSLTSQNIVPNASYFARGAIDAVTFIDDQSALYDINEMNGYIDTFVNDYYNAGIATEAGELVATMDEILALEADDDPVKRFSYSYGFFTTYELLYSGIEIKGDIYASGLLDAAYNIDSLYTEDQMMANIQEYADYLEESYNEYLSEVAAENLAQAEAFLNDNKDREGITVLPSGVQIETTFADPAGSRKPVSTDTVIVDYTLRLLDGSILDQGESVEFPLTSLIPGFVDAVVTMNIGDSATAYIPPALGYGESGNSAVAPNSLLIFDISLKEIRTAE